MSFLNRSAMAVWPSLAVLAGAAWADQVILKNGDRVTGSVVKKDGKNLVIKTDHFGVVTTLWEQVESIRTEKPVNLVLQDGKTALGKVSTEGGQVQVTGPEAKLNVKPAEIATIRDDGEQKAYERLLNPGWGDLWAGTGTVGFAGTSGNAKTLTYTTGVSAARLTNTDKTSIYFHAIKASAMVNGKSAGTAQAVRGGLGYDHNFAQRLFVNLFNDYEYDKFQNLDLRFVLGGGLGFHAAKTERSRLDLVAGGAFNRSSFSTPLIRKSGEFYWGDEYSLKLSSATSLVQSFRMFNDLTNTGTYRVNGDLGISTRLSKWLTWNVSLSDRYLSNPAPGRKTNDFLYTTGLGILFAR